MCVPDVHDLYLQCGCPIDLVVNKGYGSALLTAERRMKKLVQGALRLRAACCVLVNC